MFDGIEPIRLLAMSKQEERWLDNIKKAIYDGDMQIIEGHPEDRCLLQTCKAIDTAKTLRRSLRDESPTTVNNKAAFVEFLHFEVPTADRGGLNIELFDAAKGRLRAFSYGDLIYDIRCMAMHEGENLNVAEAPEHHILLDWSTRNPQFHGVLEDGHCVVNGFDLWSRLTRDFGEIRDWARNDERRC